MHPRIRTVFDSLDDGQCLVVCAGVLSVGKLIGDRWPKKDAATFRHHCDSQLVELGAAAFFDVVQVKEDREYARALWACIVVLDEIVMLAVALPFRVLQQLEVLIVFVRYAGDPCLLVQHRLRDRMIVAVLHAPSVAGCAKVALHCIIRAIKLLSANILGSFVPLLGSQLDERIALFLRCNIIQGDNPGARLVWVVWTGVDGGRVLLEFLTRRDPFKHLVQVTFVPCRRGVLAKWTSGFVRELVAGFACWRTLQFHVTRIDFAFADGSPKGAQLVADLAFRRNVLHVGVGVDGVGHVLHHLFDDPHCCDGVHTSHLLVLSKADPDHLFVTRRGHGAPSVIEVPCSVMPPYVFLR
mmetsp:Transcript_22437/g.62613  ORF Transcript_22437/g.62613 Transcript_22437/m.62613 type:complete len:354 (+) Transcript_22437:446-1507(+)